MLIEDQLLELFIRQNIPLNGRQVVERIRSSEPLRRVGGGTHNVATRFASRKMGCVIQAESHKSELPNLYLWEHDPDTHEFYDQPSQVKLSYKSKSGKRATHLSIPDFFLIQEDWMGWVECKPEEELLERHASGEERFVPDGNGGWRCPPGEVFASEYGLGFKVLSTKEINWPIVKNLEFLSDYLQCDLEPSGKALNIISQHFENDRWVLLQNLLDLEDVSADDIFTLVAHRMLLVDLEEDLLSEPRYTHVCLNELSLEVYRHQKAAKQAMIPLQSVLLAPGTPITWDGRPWEIVNVGSRDIFVENSDKEILSIRFDSFQKLVANGSIAGVAIESDERHNLAAERLKHASPNDLKAAVRRLTCLDGTHPDTSNIPDRTLRDWRKKAKEGLLAYGDRLVGLLPKLSARGNRLRKVDDEAIALMNEVIDGEYLSSAQPSIPSCYGTLLYKCEQHGLEGPSEKTFRAEIRFRKEYLTVLAREGRKAANSIAEYCWIIDQSTPRHGERPFEIGHIDHTTLDIQLVDSRTGANLGKPVLTVLLDAFTRVVLAFYLTFDPPSYRSCMGVIRNAVKRHGRIPRTIIVDKGSEFESTYFELLIARLNSNKKSRPGSKARFGSLIERFFGLSNQAFIHNLAGNNKALQNPRSMSSSHDPRRLASWTLSTFADAFEGFVDGYYANAKHPALGVSPNAFMARGLVLTGERRHILFPYDEAFKLLTMPTTRSGDVMVSSQRGIKIKGVHYWCDAFRNNPTMAGKKVFVRYDPFNAGRAYAMVHGEWTPCYSEFQSILERRSEPEMAAISSEIRKLYKLANDNRKINARDLAAYLSRARESEPVLLQQRRDAERLQLEQSSIDQQVSENQGATPTEKDLWSTPIDIETFEDLK